MAQTQAACTPNIPIASVRLMPNMQDDIAELRKLPYFDTAFKNVSDDMIKVYRESLAQVGETDRSDDHIREIAVWLRWRNQKCEGCDKRGNNADLLPCANCYLVFFCGQECLGRTEGRHLAVCCKHDAPMSEDDPYRPAVVPVKDVHEIQADQIKKLFNAVNRLHARVAELESKMK